MMAQTFRMAFAESWDGQHLSLRGFRSYVGRIPINPYGKTLSSHSHHCTFSFSFFFF